MLLYIDACINRATSRTERLAQAYLAKRQDDSPCEVRTVILEDEHLVPLDAPTLARRDACIANHDYSDPLFRLAYLMTQAEEVVIAAPYWDMSFPSAVKVFLEHICVNGLVFRYNEKGIPEGLTPIKRLTYITTAGGYIGQSNFGFDYVRALFQNLLGVADVRFLCAEGLDIVGNSPEQILANAIGNL